MNLAALSHARAAWPWLWHRLARAVARGAWWWTGAAAALVLAWLQPEGLRRLDLLVHDLLLPQRAASAQAPVVVAIDDASLARLGRWPWPRTLHARMVERLTEAGAAGIGFAVLFTEPDTLNPAGDVALARAIARHGQVVLAATPSRQADGRITTSLPLAGFTTGPGGARVGHVDVEVDLDGQSRSLYLQAGNGRPDLPALALAVREASATPARGLISMDSMNNVTTVDGRRPLPGTWVRKTEVFPPRVASLPMLSFADALQSADLRAAVQGRSVFIGVTATGLGAELATPLADAHTGLPAVQFHAMAFDALQHGDLVRPAPAWLALPFALLLLGSLALWPRRPGRVPVLTRALRGAILLCVPILASGLLLYGARLWLPPALATLVLGVALAFLGAGHLREARRGLQRSRQHAQAALRAIDDAVISIDARHRRIHFANRTAMRQAGPHALEGRHLEDVYPLEDASQAQLQDAITICLTQNRGVHLRELLRLRGEAGQVRSLRASVNPLHSPEGLLDGAVLAFTDVTRMIAATREREHAAHHDALTGLPNRALLQERLRMALSRVQRHGGMAAILFVDLDRFKHINDSLGHHTGDEVLKVLARRLRGLCRDTDTVARWGGDEFVMLLDNVAGPEGAAFAAGKVVEALSRDIELGPAHNHLRLPSAGSVGVVLAPRDGMQIDDLLSKADMAMYRAKEQPKAAYQVWNTDIHSRLHDRLNLEVELRQGLRDGRLMLHYQPQFSFDGRRLVGMEALMRWQRTPQHMVPPAEFIPVAEESGLIIDMGAWAVLRAARQIAQWLHAGRQPVPIAVNVSGRQCLNREFVQVVRSALQETGIPPQLLRLEITESTAMTNTDQVITLLHDIRGLGVELSMDDFGTGYSSLAHLKHFPINELKIDRSFVQALPNDHNDAAIVHATIALAHGMGLQVVAEGVESEAQSSFLASLGCDTAQGYLYGRPQPVEDITRLLG